MRRLGYRSAALSIWLFGFWLVLTWTVTAEQLVFGALLSVAVAVAMAPLGTVVAPWRLADPRRLAAVAVLTISSLGRIVRANLSLARRIWSPSRPLRSGMIIVPTTMHTDGELAAVGLVTSLIVDNQCVDLDRSADELQYHAVAVPEGSGAERAERVNAPTERLVAKVKKGMR
jgi:multicomponent Na+:H+ antiporter subunit E